MSLKVDQIVVSDNFKHNSEGFKYFLVTKKVKLLNHYVLFYLKWVGYIRYFENRGENMYFLIKDDEV